jgi:nucleotide-binding universal stress UspA family protein
VVLATDGTDASTLALDIVATWPVFADLDITVVSVSEPALGWATVDRASTSAYLLELEAMLADESRAVHAEMARAAARTLQAAGRTASDEVRVGNPAHEIVQAAAAVGADLIVTGSRSHSAASPSVIGSVARNVLQNAGTSVLVVREPTTVAAEQAAREDLIAAEAGTAMS